MVFNVILMGGAPMIAFDSLFSLSHSSQRIDTLPKRLKMSIFFKYMR
jgi:hypothetical protein